MLDVHEKLHGLQKFSLKLKSRTEAKRNQEAIGQLKNLYPFEIDSNKLIIMPTEDKGLYDVYISDVEIVNEKDYKKLIITAIIVFAVGLLCVLLVCHKLNSNKEYILQQKEIEAQKMENEKRKKENETKLAELEKEYRNLISNGYEKIYPRIERIYSVMAKGTVIENISIDKSMFVVEITTKDALGILNSFENSLLFSNVKMNRTTVKNNLEFVTYSGEFSVNVKEPDVNLSIEDKILYFEKEISLLKTRRAQQESKQLSDYINQIRKYLHANGCNEQYIQLHLIDKVSEVEFFVLSSSKGILNFLEQIQKDENDFFDIKQLRIRNSEDRNRLQTTICFQSWIKESENSVFNDDYMDKEISVSEIDKLFYKKASPGPVVKTYAKSTSVSKPIKKDTVKLKTLTYIGMSKIDGKVLIAVKDDVMGSIYKLPLCSSEIDGNCCIEIDGVYKAKIRNEYYEVKK